MLIMFAFTCQVEKLRSAAEMVEQRYLEFQTKFMAKYKEGED